MEKYINRFKSKLKKTDGCWNWTGYLIKLGYGHSSFNKKTILAHRLSWILHKGEIPDGMCICHSCDNRKCVNPDHLWIGSHTDNVRDMFIKGRNFKKSRKGENSRHRKLDYLKVENIKKLKLCGMKSVDIAKIYDVIPATICHVLKGKTWTKGGSY